MKKKTSAIFMVIYLSMLFAFMDWYLLDTFVLEQAILKVEADHDQQVQEKSVFNISLREETYLDTQIHVAEVWLEDVSQMRAAFAQDTYGRNITETVYDMSERNNAILAINGDYYGASRSGYVIRNGQLYRSDAASNQQDLCIWPDGSMSLIAEKQITAEALVADNVWQVLSFGPGLIDGGEVIVTPYSEVGNAMVSNPRTAIAMLEPLHYLFVVADGRTQQSEGLSLYELAEWLALQGAQVAYNLDGGGSSTMVYQQQVVNFPTTRGTYQERAVSDIVYISAE